MGLPNDRIKGLKTKYNNRNDKSIFHIQYTLRAKLENNPVVEPIIAMM